MLRFVRGPIGAILGGAAGCAIFVWAHRQGFYALLLPGALIGLGWSLLSKRSSLLGGIGCGAAALALGVLSEWSVRGFTANGSFGYFVTHLHKLTPLTLVMIGLGGLMAFWFVWRR